MSTTRLSMPQRAPLGGLRSQWCVVLMVLAGILLSASTAEAERGGARISRDLAAQLTAAAEGTPVDVIVTGNTDFVQKVARRHGAVVKKTLEGGAVLAVDATSLARMADDAEIGALTGDGVTRSQLANATESTGAAAA